VLDHSYLAPVDHFARRPPGDRFRFAVRQRQAECRYSIPDFADDACVRGADCHRSSSGTHGRHRHFDLAARYRPAIGVVMLDAAVSAGASRGSGNSSAKAPNQRGGTASLTSFHSERRR
jgi:hypothetical protein